MGSLTQHCISRLLLHSAASLPRVHAHGTTAGSLTLSPYSLSHPATPIPAQNSRLPSDVHAAASVPHTPGLCPSKPPIAALPQYLPAPLGPHLKGCRGPFLEALQSCSRCLHPGSSTPLHTCSFTPRSLGCVEAWAGGAFLPATPPLLWAAPLQCFSTPACLHLPRGWVPAATVTMSY